MSDTHVEDDLPFSDVELYDEDEEAGEYDWIDELWM